MINLQNYADSYIDAVLRGKDYSRRVSFRYDLLDRYDVKKDTLDGITAGSIQHGDFRPIKRSAQLTLNDYARKNIDFLSDQIQVWFLLHFPDGGIVEWPLGIFIPGTPAREINGSSATYNIGAYDKTLILTEYKFPYRQYFPRGTKYVAAVSRVLEMAGLNKIDIEDSGLTLPADKEFAVGTSAKEAISELLTAVNYESLSIDAMGYARSKAYVPPAQRQPTIHYSVDRDSIITQGFEDSLDIAGRANVFVRVAENIDAKPLTSVFKNNDPQSPLSIVNRGREITDFAMVENIANQDALDALVYRIATESTSAYRHFKLQTVNMPIHAGNEMLYLDIPGVLESPMKFSETAWEMDLRYDGLMRHEARIVVNL